MALQATLYVGQYGEGYAQEPTRFLGTSWHALHMFSPGKAGVLHLKIGLCPCPLSIERGDPRLSLNLGCGSPMLLSVGAITE